LLKTVLDEEQMVWEKRKRERERERSWSLGHIIDNVQGTTRN